MGEFVNDYKCVDCRYCFKRNALFQLLNSDELDYLNNNRLEVNFKAGEIVLKQGTPLTHIVILRNGYAKSYIEGDRQRPLILSLLSPLDMSMGPGMFVDMRHHTSLMALSDTGACFMEIAAFKAIMRQNKSFEEAFLKEYSTRMLHAYRHFSVITQKNMEGRIAEALLYLHRDVFSGNEIRHFSKQDFADLTAMTRESAIRVIKDLRSSGLIEENKDRITVLDTTGLERIAMNA